MIDTDWAERTEFSPESWSMLPGVFLADDEQQADDARLTAMAHYFSLDWASLAHTSIPTLLIRAQERMGGQQENNSESDEWKSSWAFSSHVTVVDVPGNHFSIMTGHAASTAQAASEWLAVMQRNAK